MDAFIEQIQLEQSAAASGVSGVSLLKGGLRRGRGGGGAGGSAGADVFKEVVPLCENSWKLIGQVFPNPHQVMGKFVLNVYHSKLKEHIASRLQQDKAQADSERYLDDLYTFYSKVSVVESGQIEISNAASHTISHKRRRYG